MDELTLTGEWVYQIAQLMAKLKSVETKDLFIGGKTSVFHRDGFRLGHIEFDYEIDEWVFRLSYAEVGDTGYYA